MRRRPGGALGAVAAIDQFHGYAFVLLAPEIARSLHVSMRGLGAIAVLRGAGFILAGAAAGRRVRSGQPLRVARAGAVGRGVALAVAAVPSPAAAVIGMTGYGATNSTVSTAHVRLLEESERERHRLAARLGNVAAPIVVVALAAFLAWSAVFIALAAITFLVALSLAPPRRSRDFRRDDNGNRGRDAVEGAVGGVVLLPGGRAVLVALAVAGMAELSLHLALFAHLAGPVGLSLPALGALAAAAEFVGVAANLVLGRRVPTAGSRPPQVLAAGVVASASLGAVALAVACATSSAPVAIAGLTVGALTVSVVIPLLTIGTRAVLAGAVPAVVAVPGAAAIVAVLGVAPAGDVWSAAVPGGLLLAGVAAMAVLTIRQPAAVGAILQGAVPNVTPERRMPAAEVALD
jgi:hypothetical protein